MFIPKSRSWRYLGIKRTFNSLDINMEHHTAVDNLTSELDTDTLMVQLNAQYASALIPHAVTMALFTVVGIVGNIIVIIVFSICKEYKNTNFKMFAISLACIDLLSCVTLMPAEILKTRGYFAFPNTELCKTKCFFILFGQSCAALTLFVICIDRFRKVYQPLKKQIWPDLAVKLLIGVMLVSFLLSLPAPFLCGVMAKSKAVGPDLNSNITVYFCASDKKYEKSVLRYIYKVSISAILVIVSLGFIVMYSLIMKTVIKHWSRGSESRLICVRFESTRKDDNAADVDNDQIANDVFLKERIDTLRDSEISETKPAQLQDKDSLHQHAILLDGNDEYDAKPKTVIVNTKSNSINRQYRRQSSYISHRTGSDASFRRHSVRRRSSSKYAGRIPYKTLIWFILTIIFILTYIIHSIFSFQTTKQHDKSPGALLQYVIFSRMYLINNMINPIIYVCLDKRFSKSCHDIIASFKEKIKRLC